MRPDDTTTKICKPEDDGPVIGRGRACLLLIYGPEVGRKFDLGEAPYSVGRDNTNDIMVEAESVSRRHARVDFKNGERSLVDLGSTNGTYVNGGRVTQERLESGDLVKFGGTIFKYLSGLDIESAYHEEIHKMAITDGLTQLANKRHLMEEMDRELSRARRHGRCLSVIIFDIDDFKRINDQFGHLAGDCTLREVADLTAQRVRDEDLPARYGGDEFVVLMPETGREEARAMAEDLMKTVSAKPFHFEEQTIPVSLSLGIAEYDPGTHFNPEQLVHAADQMLYKAKQSGKNRVCY